MNVTHRDLEVFAEAYSPHPLVETARHDPANGYYNWTLNKPLLCYQAIHLTLKQLPASQSPQPVQAGPGARNLPPQDMKPSPSPS